MLVVSPTRGRLFRGLPMPASRFPRLSSSMEGMLRLRAPPALAGAAFVVKVTASGLALMPRRPPTRSRSPMPASRLERAPLPSTTDDSAPFSTPLAMGTGMLLLPRFFDTDLRSSAPVELVATLPSDSGSSTVEVTFRGLNTALEMGSPSTGSMVERLWSSSRSRPSRSPTSTPSRVELTRPEPTPVGTAGGSSSWAGAEAASGPVSNRAAVVAAPRTRFMRIEVSSVSPRPGQTTRAGAAGVA